MYANLEWAKSIQEQGWLNPHPHHPYVTWMKPIGTLDDWTRWWGGEQIFQQSPLYAYFLALMLSIFNNVLYVHVVQGLCGMALCVLLGLIAARLGGDHRAGWIAFAIAALYAPFYAYSWALLRDIIAWVVTAGLLLVLIELTGDRQPRGRQRLLAFGAGLLLGFGYLTREIFALLAPLVALACAFYFLRRREYLSPVLVVIGTGLVLLPLLIRNHQVGAPLFSTSNRFAEGIIIGHAGSAEFSKFTIPTEARSIFEKSDGRPGRVIVEALRTQPSFASWFRLQCNKALSVFDPYEPIDNVNLYFFGHISPLVSFGLRHWTVLIPGLGGLLLSLSRRNLRHAWLWLFLPVLMANLLIAQPMSRYRQFLMVLWIPWAAYFLLELIKAIRSDRRLACVMAGLLVAGWTACLGPLARVPPKEYDRPVEYSFAARIYENLGDTERANEMREIVREKFPEWDR